MRTKGHWIKIGYMDSDVTDTFRCSFCNRHIYLEFETVECDYRFCPYCGARMNEHVKEEC